MSNRTENITIRQILMFSLPLTASGVLQTLFNVADVAITGKYAGGASMAAIGATTSIVNLLVGTFIGMSVGVNILVSRSIGAGCRERTTRAIHSAFALSLVMGILVLAIGWCFSRPLLQLIDTPEDILPLSVLYLRIYFLGVPAAVSYNFCAAILRAFGDTRRPLLYLLISGIANVLLNLLFVAGFGMSVDGVAIATTVSQYLSLFFVVRCLLRADGEMRLSIDRIRMNREDALSIIKIGFPAGFQTVVFNIANITVQGAINTFGTAVIAGNTAAANIDSLLHIAMNSVYHATLTYTSRSVGGAHWDRIPSVFRSAMASVLLIGLPLSLSCTIFAPQILGIYVSPSDPIFAETIAAGLVRIHHVTVLYITSGIMEICCGMVRGMGHSWLPMFVTAFCACVIRILWVLFVFPIVNTLGGLYWCFPISFVATSIVHFVCFIIIYRRTISQKRLA